MQYLDGSAAGGDERLHGGGVIPSCKLLLLRLPPLHHRDGHQLLVHPRVQIQDLKHLFGCLLFGGKGRVSLLPQELSGSQEGLRVLELPSLEEKKLSFKKEERHLSRCTELRVKGPKLTTTLHHWLSLIGRSLCDWTHFA